MKKIDLFILCMQNLFRRKSRTILTVIGVVIGCCAIDIMVSIGIGSREAQDVMLSQMGDLTLINIYDYGGYIAEDAGGSGERAVLNDAALDSFSSIPGVVAVTPKLQLYDLPINLYAGLGDRYRTMWLSVIGMSDDAIEALGYELIEGDYINGEQFAVLAGQFLAYDFCDTKRPDGYNMVDRYSTATWDEETQSYTNYPDPYFDIMTTPIEARIDTGEGNKPIKQKLTVAGVMKEDYSKGWETSECLIMRLEDLKLLRDQYMRATGTKNDKEDTYDQVVVKVDDIKHVKEVEDAIKEQGYNTSSMESIREPLEKEAQQRQLMLGGLGAISLLVAAIGITNTMIMSISERTREIGIMKALGCYLHDIRTIFLMEAGMIGVIGGVIGVALSYAISAAMNLVSSGMPITSISDAMAILGQVGSRMSVMPAWLALFSLLFSLFIGLISGYYPANRAVKISAMEAIKRE